MSTSSTAASSAIAPGSLAAWAVACRLPSLLVAISPVLVGATLGFESLGMVTISDMISESGEAERISDEELKRGVNQMMEVACEVAISDYN